MSKEVFLKSVQGIGAARMGDQIQIKIDSLEIGGRLGPRHAEEINQFCAKIGITGPPLGSIQFTGANASSTMEANLGHIKKTITAIAASDVAKDRKEAWTNYLGTLSLALKRTR